MKEVFVYVEGPSDQLGLRMLLKNIIKKSQQQGNKLDFFPLGGKEPLLNKGPLKAINILCNKPHSFVFLVPDLYPKNTPFKHENFEELKKEIECRFFKELEKKHYDKRIKERFFIHCFKYDFESLLLATETNLLNRLNAKKCTAKWIIPVENQNFNKPPKRIVELLFKNEGKKYKDTIDAPWILEQTDYKDLYIKCNQNFKPFIDDLLKILEIN